MADDRDEIRRLRAENDTLRRQLTNLTAGLREEDGPLGDEIPAPIRTMVKFSPDPVAVHRRGVSLMVNRALVELLEFDSEDEIVGRAFLDFVHPKHHQEIVDLASLRRKGFQMVTNQDATLTTAEGRSRFVNVSSIPLHQDAEPLTLSFLHDRTDLARAQDELQRSEARYRAVFEQSTDVIYISTIDGRVVEVNRAVKGLLGRSVQEITSGLADRFYASEEERYRVAREILDRGFIRDRNVILVHADGHKVECLETAVLQRDEKGEPTGFIGTFRDVTESRRARRRLEVNERRYRELVENAPLGILSFDFKGRIRQVNDKLTAILGSPSQRATRAINVFELPMLVEAGVTDDFRRCIDEGRPLQADRPYISKWGRQLQLRYHLNPTFDSTGKINGAQAIVEDYTALKEAEDALRQSEGRYRDLFDSITDLVYTQDMEGRFLTVNRAVTVTLGLPREKIIGTRSLDYMLPEQKDGFEPEYLAPLREKGFVRGACRYLTADGGQVWVEYSSQVVSGPGGQPYISGSGRDVTARMAAAQEVKHLQDQLLQAQKMEAIGTLAGGIAHDFNNLLAAIMGYTELAITELHPGSHVRDNLDQVLKAGRRATDLVRQILSFSRQTGQGKAALDLGIAVKETCKLLRSTLPVTVEMEQNIATGLEPVMANPTQMHQLLMNICTNAAQAMDPDGGRLTINLDRMELTEARAGHYLELEPGPYLALTVTDTGPGVDERTRKRMFEPFFTTKAPGKGTGMGLAVVHGIVKDHGGQISVDSTLGQGTGFTVLLPVCLEEPVPEVEGRDPVRKGGGEHILLVDDEPALVDVGRQMLERLGYRVTAFTSPGEALEFFLAHPRAVDLVLSDQTMPRLTGDRLVSQMMEVRPDLPVILCTGFSEKLTEDGALSLGIGRYLLKPLVMKETAEAVRSLLDRDGEA